MLVMMSSTINKCYVYKKSCRLKAINFRLKSIFACIEKIIAGYPSFPPIIDDLSLHLFTRPNIINHYQVYSVNALTSDILIQSASCMVLIWRIHSIVKP